MTSLIIIDDSLFTRKILRRLIAKHPSFYIVSEAKNGYEGLKKIQEFQPDIVILDVEMPLMSGLELLKEVKKQQYRPRFLIFSAHTKKHAQITIDCLLAGGSDYICKPQFDPTLQTLEQELIDKLTSLCTASHVPTSYSPVFEHTLPPKLICIATSTGGPDTLKNLLLLVKKDLSIPILIVQHMPPLFTSLLSQTLSRQTEHTILEAKEQGEIHKNSIILARGGTHLIVERERSHYVYRSSNEPPVHGLRPAADLLFSSASIAAQSRVLGIILTGMGQDGTKGAQEIHNSGGQVIIQDKKSSIIWGMPGSVLQAGIPAKQKTIPEIAALLNQYKS